MKKFEYQRNLPRTVKENDNLANVTELTFQVITQRFKINHHVDQVTK
jgi:hypothetical protein